MTPSIDELRNLGERPRVHGNGFIQLDLAPRLRLHVWGDTRIPRQKVATPIHDHVFGFKSRVIVGRLLNVVYQLTFMHSGTHLIYNPYTRDQEDTVLVDSGLGRVTIEPLVVDLLTANTKYDNYELGRYKYHETLAPDGVAVSIIEKDGPTVGQGAERRPGVLVPVGVLPDNSFNRYDHDEDLLWSIIENALAKRS